jgi:hypothetical protein
MDHCKMREEEEEEEEEEDGDDDDDDDDAASSGVRDPSNVVPQSPTASPTSSPTEEPTTAPSAVRPLSDKTMLMSVTKLCGEGGSVDEGRKGSAPYESPFRQAFCVPTLPPPCQWSHPASR